MDKLFRGSAVAQVDRDGMVMKVYNHAVNASLGTRLKIELVEDSLSGRTDLIGKGIAPYNFRTVAELDVKWCFGIDAYSEFHGISASDLLLGVPVKAIFEDGTVLESFESITEASVVTGIDGLTIFKSAIGINLTEEGTARYNFEFIGGDFYGKAVWEKH